MKPTKIATPLQGRSQVPIQSPKYSTKPGPAKVDTALLRVPIRTIMTTIVGLVSAKLLQSLMIKSAIARHRREKATPLRSPSMPQKNAPPMDMPLQSMLTQPKKWSSWTMGMKMIFKFMPRCTSYRHMRKEIRKMMMNRGSFNDSLTSGFLGIFAIISSSDFIISVGLLFSMFYFSDPKSFLPYSFSYISVSPSTFLFMRKDPITVRTPDIRKPIMAVLCTLLVTSQSKKLISPSFTVVDLLSGFIRCMKNIFQNKEPTPNEITRRAVILLRDYGNRPHIVFSTGMAIIANDEAGTMTEKNTNIWNLKKIAETKGEKKKIKEHTLMTFSWLYLLQSLVAAKVAKIMGMTVRRRMNGLVVSVTRVP